MPETGQQTSVRDQMAGLRQRVEAGFDRAVRVVPQLARGLVWCRSCGVSQKVDSGQCLRSGWPKCCGATMTIDSPEEQQALSPRKGGSDEG